MGFLIISRVNRDGQRLYCAWMPDDKPIADIMTQWLAEGMTVEILDYVPNTDVVGYNLVGRIARWQRHFKKAGDPCKSL